MKIYRLEQEDLKQTKIPRRKGAPRMDRKVITKIGNAIYHQKGIKSVCMTVGFNDGSHIHFSRSESKDDMERFKAKIDEELDDE